jgi:hypothetical protein
VPSPQPQRSHVEPSGRGDANTALQTRLISSTRIHWHAWLAINARHRSAACGLKFPGQDTNSDRGSRAASGWHSPHPQLSASHRRSRSHERTASRAMNSSAVIVGRGSAGASGPPTVHPTITTA